MVVDIFSKMTHLIPCKNRLDTVHIEDLLLKDIVTLHRLPKTIFFDKDTKFIGYFWRTLWKKLNIELKSSSTFHQQIDG